MSWGCVGYTASNLKARQFLLVNLLGWWCFKWPFGKAHVSDLQRLGIKKRSRLESPESDGGLVGRWLSSKPRVKTRRFQPLIFWGFLGGFWLDVCWWKYGRCLLPSLKINSKLAPENGWLVFFILCLKGLFFRGDVSFREGRCCKAKRCSNVEIRYPSPTTNIYLTHGNIPN